MGADGREDEIDYELAARRAREYFEKNPDAMWMYQYGWYAINEGAGVIAMARYIGGFNMREP